MIIRQIIFLVQHYVEEIGSKNHCRVNSVSDSISPLGTTKIGVTWELKIVPISNDQCELHNHVAVSSTPEFLALLESLNIEDLTLVKSQMLQNLKVHNNEEHFCSPIILQKKEKRVFGIN